MVNTDARHESLDFETRELFDEWLRKNRSYIAEVCAEQFERDMEAILIDARRGGLSPQEAMRLIPKWWKIQLGLERNYLLARDEDEIRRIREVRERGVKSFAPYYAAIVGGAVISIGSLFAFAEEAAWASFALVIALPAIFLAYASFLKVARVRGIDAKGARGVPLASVTSVYAILPIVGLLGLFQLILHPMHGRLGVTIMLLGVCAIPAYIANRALAERVQHNLNAVGELLGVPEYGDDKCAESE